MVLNRSKNKHLSHKIFNLQQPLSGLEKSKKRFALIVVVPFMTYLLLWTLIPYAWVILLSFFKYSPRRDGGFFLGLGGSNPFIGLKHYKDMLNFADDAPRHIQLFHIALKNTILFSFIVVPLNLLITIPLAVLVNNVRVRGLTKVLRTVFFVPVITSSVGVGIMWGYIFNPQKGILNSIISEIVNQRIAISWLRDVNLNLAGIPIALFSIIIAYLWFDIGYNFIIFSAGLQNIPDSLIEAAEIDGASGPTVFTKIILPLLRPQILLTSILTMISAFQMYDLVQVMTKGGPNHQTRVIILDVFQNAFRNERMGFAGAESIVFFAIVIIISLVQKRVLQHDWEY